VGSGSPDLTTTGLTLGNIATTSNAKIEKKNPRINQPNALRPFDDATTAHAIARNNQSARYSTEVPPIRNDCSDYVRFVDSSAILA
jgi:hypothetical protein